ncbi:MAG: helicase-related protein [Ignavibacteriota bacterium]
MPRERREIERRLRNGEIRAVVATNALELGIDIGFARCRGDGGVPGDHRVELAACGPRRTAAGHLRRGAGSVERAARSIHRRASRFLLRPVARARLHQSRESGNPDGAPEVRRVRIAVARRREIRPARHRARSVNFWRRPDFCTTRVVPGTGRRIATPPTPRVCVRWRATTSW